MGVGDINHEHSKKTNTCSDIRLKLVKYTIQFYLFTFNNNKRSMYGAVIIIFFITVFTICKTNISYINRVHTAEANTNLRRFPGFLMCFKSFSRFIYQTKFNKFDHQGSILLQGKVIDSLPKNLDQVQISNMWMKPIGHVSHYASWRTQKLLKTVF